MKRKIVKLNNGGNLIYEKSKQTNATAVEVGFKIGAFNEKKPGTAHFLEHTLFKKTKNRDNVKLENDRSEIVFLNATTSAEYIILTFYRSNKLIEKSMEFASDVLINSVLDDEFMESERQVIIEELGICKDVEDRDIYVRNLRQAQEKTMFSSDIVGKNETNIKKITFKDLLDFKRKYFIGNNFIISVVSSLSLSKIKRLVNKYFVRNIKFELNFDPILPYFESNFINKDSSLKCVNIPQEKVSVLISFKINSNEIGLMKNLNFSFLSKYFSGLQGDLFLKLRNRGLIYRINSDFICFFKESLLNLYFETSKEKIPEIIEILSIQIKSILNNGIKNNYLESYKNNYEYYADEKMPRKSTLIVHENLMDFIDFGKIIDFTKNQKKKMIQSVSESGVKNIAKQIFNKNNKIFVTVMGDVKSNKIPNLEFFKEKLLIAEE